MADSLFYQAQEQRINIRYSELINKKPKDTRSGDDIARDVILKAGLVVK